MTRSLASAVAAAIDTAALDPGLGATAARPASLTNGAIEVMASGDVATDVGRLLSAISGGAPIAPYVITGWVGATRMAAFLDNLQRLGVGVLVSPGAPADVVIVIDATGVALAATDVRMLVANHADLLMDDGSSPAGVTMLRLWQSGMAAFMTERDVNWSARSDAVAWLATGSPA